MARKNSKKDTELTLVEKSKKGDVIITEADRIEIRNDVDKLFKRAQKIEDDVDSLIDDVGHLVEKYGLVEYD